MTGRYACANIEHVQSRGCRHRGGEREGGSAGALRIATGVDGLVIRSSGA